MRNLVLCGVLLLASPAAAQRPVEIPLWTGVAPGSEGKTGDEVVETSASGELRITNVHRPSLTPYLPPKDTATGVAVLVIPGGGHRQLVITHEGYNVAEWFRAHGIAAFVLKHRLAREPNSTYKIDVEALADATAGHAPDPQLARRSGDRPGQGRRHGVLRRRRTRRDDRDARRQGIAAATDAIDRESARPDFQALIYPGRTGDIQPDANTSPAFLAAAYDDRQDIAEGLAEVYLRMKRAGVPGGTAHVRQRRPRLRRPRHQHASRRHSGSRGSWSGSGTGRCSDERRTLNAERRNA